MAPARMGPTLHNTAGAEERGTMMKVQALRLNNKKKTEEKNQEALLKRKAIKRAAFEEFHCSQLHTFVQIYTRSVPFARHIMFKMSAVNFHQCC